ncbi:DUF1028 domain-containing protein [Methanocella sp. MCL-LM]|uniref:DUF1028 domain-containing protein n=1 Tax=Methanocella sp. MCL-LM TaxID=3412035 RepID=UPI003C782EED
MLEKMQAKKQPQLARPVSTYSIVARDPATGEMGVAVQSHWFSVGSVVPWAEAGVGAVATQAFSDPAYGPLGLAAMRAGRSAPDALKGLLAGDQGRELRQVAMIDANGGVAGHTGSRCLQPAGNITDSEAQFSVQANMMANDRVWPAMAKAYREAEGDLAGRLITVLEAAEAAGGDIRGRQSAALVVVSGQSTGKPWVDRRFDLRVEDHPEPVAELKRLVRLQRAYLHMNAGDLAVEKNDVVAANAEYAMAEKLAPELVEIPFWCAVTLVNAGKVEEALPIFRDVFEREKMWAELIPRLVESGMLVNDPAVIKRIFEMA